jgi:hypothetical protein
LEGWSLVAIDPRLERLMTVERYETHVGAEDVDHLAQIARFRA